MGIFVFYSINVNSVDFFSFGCTNCTTSGTPKDSFMVLSYLAEPPDLSKAPPLVCTAFSYFHLCPFTLPTCVCVCVCVCVCMCVCVGLHQVVICFSLKLNFSFSTMGITNLLAVKTASKVAYLVSGT